MELRAYQTEIVERIRLEWQQGNRNVLAQLDTGAGKTVVFSKIISENTTGVSIAIAHRMEILSQISLTLGRYRIRHNVIAPRPTIRKIVALHMSELKRSYYDPQARCNVAGVDTLIRMDPNTSWFKQVNLVIQDEGHHPLKNNKWGRAAALFPNAYGLYPTATPIRADGCGLGRHADGLIDALIVGPGMRNLINMGYLTDYRIIAPETKNLNLADIPLSASGDYSPPKLRAAVHKSQITGDVVTHYLKFAAGKLGVTFAVDIESATEIAHEFRTRGVSAEVISSKTPDLLRFNIMDRFKRREIMQLVNVDLLGEGVDVPAIEVVSMARPTQSYGLYAQQFGRALRPMEGKSHAIIIDHVNNIVRHGLPDRRRTWSLDRRDRKSRGTITEIPLRNCLNPECLAVYERVKKTCPYCGFYSAPASRASPEFVDGDLTELDPSVLAKLRGEVDRVDAGVRVPQHLDPVAQHAITNRHRDRQHSQIILRDAIALWAGYLKADKQDDSEIYRRFYFNFSIDIVTAQTLGVKDSEELTKKIKFAIDGYVNIS